MLTRPPRCVQSKRGWLRSSPGLHPRRNFCLQIRSRWVASRSFLWCQARISMNKGRLDLQMKPQIRVLSHWVPLVQALGILTLGQRAYSSSANPGGADSGVANGSALATASPRERISLNAGWRFTRNDPDGVGERLRYANIKDWVLPTAAELAKGAALAAKARPAGNPGGDISYAQSDFDDSQWRLLNLPHDWGIEGPFKQEYPGETGKLPWWGVAWYRKHLAIPAADAGRRIYLDVDGAMSYATVWLNGQFVGGWPYGYASWRVDLTPFVKVGRGQCPRHPARQSAGFLALVSGRRHLPQRLAGQNRAGACRPLGHLCHHAGDQRPIGDRENPGQRGQRRGGRCRRDGEE